MNVTFKQNTKHSCMSSTRAPQMQANNLKIWNT